VSAAIVDLRDYRVEHARETAALYRGARLKSRFGAEARAMLSLEGVDEQLAETLHIGVSATDPFDLVSRLTAKGVSGDDARSAGVVDAEGKDPLRGAITVPVLDITGRIVAFLGWDLVWQRRGGAA
jgi:DNA primase